MWPRHPDARIPRVSLWAIKLPNPVERALGAYSVYRSYRFVQLEELTKIGQAQSGICFTMSLDWLRRLMAGKRGLKDRKFNPHKHSVLSRSARAAASGQRRQLTQWHRDAFTTYEANHTADWQTILLAVQATAGASSPFSAMNATTAPGEWFDRPADFGEWIAPLLRSMKHQANRTGLFLSLVGPGRGIGHAVACHYEVGRDRFRFFDPNAGEYAVSGRQRGTFTRLVAANIGYYLDNGFKVVRPTFFH